MDPDALWAAEEFGEAELGDVRCDACLVQLVTVLGAQPNASLPDATDDPAMLKACLPDNCTVAGGSEWLQLPATVFYWENFIYSPNGLLPLNCLYKGICSIGCTGR